MDLPNRSLEDVEPYLIHGLDPSNHESWEQAYVAAESYFCALGIQNRLLLAHLIGQVLRASVDRVNGGETREPASIVMEETRRIIAGWFLRVTGERLPDDRVASQSILALLLADMPGKWQPWFLRNSDWPEEFATQLRKAYAEAGPRFQKSTMKPQVLELGHVGNVAGKSLELLGRAPAIRSTLVFIFWSTVLIFMGIILWGI